MQEDIQLHDIPGAFLCVLQFQLVYFFLDPKHKVVVFVLRQEHVIKIFTRLLYLLQIHLHFVHLLTSSAAVFYVRYPALMDIEICLYLYS